MAGLALALNFPRIIRALFEAACLEINGQGQGLVLKGKYGSCYWMNSK